MNVDFYTLSEEYINTHQDYYFFYSGPFSQWHRCQFTDPKQNLRFCCAEQYMMYMKSILFGDPITASLILKTTYPSEHQRLGRSCKHFNSTIWDKESILIVYQGNEYKFQQNKYLYQELANTKGKILVECSPSDKIWGIGRGMKDKLRFNLNTWNGQNRLGYILTMLRINLIGE